MAGRDEIGAGGTCCSPSLGARVGRAVDRDGRGDVLVDARHHTGVARLEGGTVDLHGLSPSILTISGTVMAGAECSDHVSLQCVNRMRWLFVLTISSVPVVSAPA